MGDNIASYGNSKLDSYRSISNSAKGFNRKFSNLSQTRKLLSAQMINVLKNSVFSEGLATARGKLSEIANIGISKVQGDQMVDLLINNEDLNKAINDAGRDLNTINNFVTMVMSSLSEELIRILDHLGLILYILSIILTIGVYGCSAMCGLITKQTQHLLGVACQVVCEVFFIIALDLVETSRDEY